MASEAKILQLIARVALFTVESTMNLTYQIVTRSCYKPGKKISNVRWEPTLPKGFSGFPEHWIIILPGLCTYTPVV